MVWDFIFILKYALTPFFFFLAGFTASSWLGDVSNGLPPSVRSRGSPSSRSIGVQQPEFAESRSEPVCNADRAKVAPFSGETNRALFSVSGMTCSSCVNTIESVLRAVPGVKEATVSLIAERAEILFDPSSIGSPETTFLTAIEDVGFKATPLQESEDEVILDIKGMTCASCSNSIESILREEPGVIFTSVSVATEKGRVKYDPNRIGIRKIIELVDDVRSKSCLVCRPAAYVLFVCSLAFRPLSLKPI